MSTQSYRQITVNPFLCWGDKCYPYPWLGYYSCCHPGLHHHFWPWDFPEHSHHQHTPPSPQQGSAKVDEEPHSWKACQTTVLYEIQRGGWGTAFPGKCCQWYSLHQYSVNCCLQISHCTLVLLNNFANVSYRWKLFGKVVLGF